MDNLISASFEAHNYQRNHHRWYSVSVGRDLFGDWTIAFRYGRSGSMGREVRRTGSDPKQLQSLLRACLRRRLSAPKRIGCQYQLTAINAVDDIRIEEWVSDAILRGFTAPLDENAGRSSHEFVASCSEEVDRRVAAFQSGNSKAIDVDLAMLRAREDLSERRLLRSTR